MNNENMLTTEKVNLLEHQDREFKLDSLGRVATKESQQKELCVITRVSENDGYLYVGETVREGKHNQAAQMLVQKKLKYKWEMVCGSRHTT